MKKLIKLLDNIFSQYIRLRETNENGYGTCIYCGNTVKYQDSENCHYIPRGKLSLRWSDLNCNIGHIKCNREDNRKKIGEGIILKYGYDVVKWLESYKYIHKPFKFELQEKIKYFRTENRRLTKDKNFPINLT